jgi:hypothetical protein
MRLLVPNSYFSSQFAVPQQLGKPAYCVIKGSADVMGDAGSVDQAERRLH